MRTSRRPSDSPSPGGNDSVDRPRRPDNGDGKLDLEKDKGVDKTRGNRTDAAIDAMSPPAMAGNTLMDGAAGQLPGSPPQMNYDLGGPDSDEDE